MKKAKTVSYNAKLKKFKNGNEILEVNENTRYLVAQNTTGSNAFREDLSIEERQKRVNFARFQKRVKTKNLVSDLVLNNFDENSIAMTLKLNKIADLDTFFKIVKHFQASVKKEDNNAKLLSVFDFSNNVIPHFHSIVQTNLKFSVLQEMWSKSANIQGFGGSTYVANVKNVESYSKYLIKNLENGAKINNRQGKSLIVKTNNLEKPHQKMVKNVDLERFRLSKSHKVSTKREFKSRFYDEIVKVLEFKESKKGEKGAFKQLVATFIDKKEDKQTILESFRVLKTSVYQRFKQLVI